RINKDIFQDPNYCRHDSFGYNYRMPEIAAAMGMAQTERIEEFIDLRIKIANLYTNVIKNCDYLIPQKIPEGYRNTYWTYALRFEHPEVSWQDFRKKYMEMGGDGIYAAWALSYIETIISSEAFKRVCPPLYNELSFPKGICAVAEEVQPKIMQFVNNYGSPEEAEPKVEALLKTIKYFR
ncbi:DegT/DnrJ/EryC1/StrS family aminotransferase, partial [Bacteroidota bacterium]